MFRFRYLVVSLVIAILVGGYVAFGGRLSLPNRETHPVNTSAVYCTNLTSANNLFALELYSELSRNRENVLISPYSVFTALAMVYEGAGGRTASAMGWVLHLSHPPGPSFLSFLERLRGKVNTANAVWVQRGFKVRSEYVRTIGRYYEGEFEELDFKGDPQGAAETINEWTASRTKGRIKRIIGHLDRSTRVVITDAVYLNATWVHKFRPSYTLNASFLLPSGKTVVVPMMHQENTFDYMETDTFKAIELPYTNGLAMLVILPKRVDGLWSLNLTPGLLERITKDMRPETVSVSLPKFTLNEFYDLKGPLTDMGMGIAFSRDANLSGIGKDLFISDVSHRAFIRVAENGTEAAAVTAVVISVTYVPSDVKTFNANHPFIFMILDRDTGAVLFIGSLVYPAHGGAAGG
ncbi:MAG: serpin family protein [Thermococci archaeon]|nr:serpin family protein [Thermococci archaeon]